MKQETVLEEDTFDMDLMEDLKRAIEAIKKGDVKEV